MTSHDNGDMNPLALYIAMFVTLVPIPWTGSLLAHVFETGHIERSVDIVVRGDNVQVKYSIGLADETILDWLSREGLLEQTEETRFRKCIKDFEEVESKQQNSTNESNDKPTRADGAEEEVVEPVAFQKQLMKLLREKLAGSVCQKLKLTFAGKEIEFSEVTVSESARHHVAMEVLLKAKLTTAKRAKGSKSDRGGQLTFVDGNFLEMTEAGSQESTASTPQVESQKTLDPKEHEFRYGGNVRLACRVKGNAIQLNSNVAPILARSKPVDVSARSLEERVEAATIRCQIGFARPKTR